MKQVAYSLLFLVIVSCESADEFGPAPTTPYAFTSRIEYSLDEQLTVTVVPPMSEISMGDCCGSDNLAFYIDRLESNEWVQYSFTTCLVMGCPTGIVHLASEGFYTFVVTLPDVLYGYDPPSGVYRLRIPYQEPEPPWTTSEIMSNSFLLVAPP